MENKTIDAAVKVTRIRGSKPARYKVTLEIGVQSFVMGGEFWERTRTEAHWLQKQLVTALVNLMRGGQ